MKSVFTSYVLKEPVLGNRSRECFGLALFLEPGFFGETSHNSEGKKQQDPRITLFERVKQLRQKKDLLSSMEKKGLGDSFPIQWRKIVDCCTEKATLFVKAKTNRGGDISNPLLIESDKSLIKAAFFEGFKEMVGRVGVIKENVDQVDTEPLLPLFNQTKTIVYLREEGGIFRIGKTNDKSRREKDYKSHSISSRLIGTIEERGNVTESNIHKLFSGKRIRDSFYRLEPEDVALFFSPLLSLEISKNNT